MWSCDPAAKSLLHESETAPVLTRSLAEDELVPVPRGVINNMTETFG